MVFGTSKENVASFWIPQANIQSVVSPENGITTALLACSTICYVRLCKTLKDTAELEEHVLVLHPNFLCCSCFKLLDLLSIDWRKHFDNSVVCDFIDFTCLDLDILNFTHLDFVH